MPNITQTRRIARDVKTRFGVRIECIRLRARKAKKSLPKKFFILDRPKISEKLSFIDDKIEELDNAS